MSLKRKGVPLGRPVKGGRPDGCQKLTSLNCRRETYWYQRLSVTPAQKRIDSSRLSCPAILAIHKIQMFTANEVLFRSRHSVAMNHRQRARGKPRTHKRREVWHGVAVIAAMGRSYGGRAGRGGEGQRPVQGSTGSPRWGVGSGQVAQERCGQGQRRSRTSFLLGTAALSDGS